MLSGYFYFILAVVGLSCAQRQMLVLELSATNVTAGDQLIVNCTAQVTAQSRVLYINGQPASERIADDRLSTTATGTTTTYTIDPVEPEDAGEYYCFAGGDQGAQSDSPTQNVTVYVPPVLVLELSATNVTVGGQLTASCTAQAITAIRVLYIGGESVAQRISADRLSSNSSGTTTTWIIDPVKSEDAGQYYCFAGSDQGTHLNSPTQNVTVYVLPNPTNPTTPGTTEICPAECHDCEVDNPTCCSSCTDGLTLHLCTCVEDDGQAFTVYQLVGFGAGPALFILLLLTLTITCVYVLTAKRRAKKTITLV